MTLNESRLKPRNNAKICFVGLGHTYSLLIGGLPKNIIGPDVHQVLLAKELVKHGADVTFIVYNVAERDTELIDGINVISIQKVTTSIRIINIMLNFINIFRAMKASKANIYFHAGSAFGIASVFSKLLRKKFIYSVASDALVNTKIITKKNKEFNQSRTNLSTFGNWLDIKLADDIIVQSEHQRKMLTLNYKRNSKIIKMPFPISKRETFIKAEPPIILWVGAMAEVKQPELFIYLAKRMPDAKFVMIGGSTLANLPLYERIKKNSKKIPNLDFLGTVPFHEIDKYFSRASILVNTSMFEGFPNAFIQAWIHYVPVVSLNADPDGLISQKKLGLYSKTFEQLVEDVEILSKNKEQRKKIAQNARMYVERNHDITKISAEYIKLFEQTLEG